MQLPAALSPLAWPLTVSLALGSTHSSPTGQVTPIMPWDGVREAPNLHSLIITRVIPPPPVLVALKIKVKEITYINRDTKIILETKSKTIYKLNGVSERDLKKSVLWLKDSLQCTCEEMNDINAPYLVMGQKLGGELVITSVKRWQKGQREFKRISRSIRKLQC